MSVEFERIRQRGRERLKQLAEPREPKIEWWTNIGPKVKWGTQEMMWDIPKSALRTTASARVSELATPKKDFQRGTNKANGKLYFYSCGRESKIWDVSPNAVRGSASERVMELSHPKRTHVEYQANRSQFYFSCGRSSPIWNVDDSAQRCGNRERTANLAMAKRYHSDFLPERQVQTVIPEAALRARSSERVSSLASPKERNPGPFRAPCWEVTGAAKNASASSRTVELARAKGTTEGFLPAREVEWIVGRAAKRAVASSRLDELSKPIVRASMDNVQFNPDAFIVKETALKGIVPRRIDELAQPIQRG